MKLLFILLVNLILAVTYFAGSPPAAKAADQFCTISNVHYEGSYLHFYVATSGIKSLTGVSAYIQKSDRSGEQLYDKITQLPTLGTIPNLIYHFRYPANEIPSGGTGYSIFGNAEGSDGTPIPCDGDAGTAIPPVPDDLPQRGEPPGGEGGVQIPTDPDDTALLRCGGVPSDRFDECMKDPIAYNSDPCQSKHYAESGADQEKKYNSTECKTTRGKKYCEKQESIHGAVYLRAFGADPEFACVTFLQFTKVIVDYALLAATIICAFMFLRGGLKYTMSRGDPAGLFEARDMIMHATIGLVLLATAYIIILFLQGSLGFLHLNLVGPFGAVFGR